MSDLAIKVENLSKRYRIGKKGKRPDTLFGAAIAQLKAPRARFKQLRQLSDFNENGRDSDDVIWALKDVNFEVSHGEILGLIGRNGAGKSTLLKVLSQITEPTAGRAVINGRVSSLLEVGTGFHPELTGRENIYLNGTVLGMSAKEIDRKFDEIVDFSGVEKFLDTPVKRYSSGMKVRLGFAVAAHLDQEILMIDEVLAVGDAGFQKKCLGKISDVARSGRTILLVSHNMMAIQSMCSKVLLLDDGMITFEGPTAQGVMQYMASMEQVRQQPLHLRTDREGGDDFRFADVQFLSHETLTPWPALLSGQPVVIRIGYISSSEKKIKNVAISITIFTPTGAHLFGCVSMAVGVTLDVRQGEGFTDCYLPRWPLKAGRYTYDLVAYIGENDLDWIQNAGAFDVEPGDYYGSGSVPSAENPGVLVDYIWQEEMNDEPMD